MAQDTKPTIVGGTKPDGSQIPPETGNSRFHTYSGGEVKELANTGVPKFIWVTAVGVILFGIYMLFFGGALGPRMNGYHPEGGGSVGQAAMSQDLQQRSSAAGVSYASLDISRIPVPAGVSVTESIKRGSDIYTTNCIGCHGPNQDGNGVGASNLNPKPRNLHDGPFMQAMSYQRINTSLHKGVPGTAMPRWENTLNEDQIKEVIAFVLSLTTPAAASSAPPATPTGSSTGTSGGTQQYTGGSTSVSPKPMTPAVNGNPAADTSTAPPSQSGQPTDTNKPGLPLKPAAPIPSGSSAPSGGVPSI